MPTTNNANPDGRLLIRIVGVIGAIFGVIVVVFFVRSAPFRSPDACAVSEAPPSSSDCLACHVNPHRDGTGYQIRRVDGKSGRIETVAENAPMRNPTGIVTGSDGTRYGVSPLEHVVWKQEADAQRPTILAGVILNGRAVRGFGGDGGPATGARLNRPSAVAVDATGRVYVADTMNNRVRRIGRDGVIETVAGSGRNGFDGDGKPAIRADIEKPTSIAFDRDGNLLIAHSNGRVGRVRQVELASGIIETLVGGGTARERKGDGTTEAVLKRPVEVSVDPTTGDIFIAESRPVLRHWNVGNCALCHRLPH
jgi:DNA-binding beta-propeller fold protein YncE